MLHGIVCCSDVLCFFCDMLLLVVLCWDVLLFVILSYVWYYVLSCVVCFIFCLVVWSFIRLSRFVMCCYFLSSVALVSSSSNLETDLMTVTFQSWHHLSVCMSVCVYHWSGAVSQSVLMMFWGVFKYCVSMLGEADQRCWYVDAYRGELLRKCLFSPLKYHLKERLNIDTEGWGINFEPSRGYKKTNTLF